MSACRPCSFTPIFWIVPIMAAAQQAEYDCISSLDEVGNIAGELLDGCVVEALDVSE